MKNLILFFVLLRLSAAAQTVSSAALALTYHGYATGQYSITITNNQACPAAIKLNWNSRTSDSVINLAAASSMNIFITAPYDASSSIKIKTNDLCTAGANAGYISVPVATTLALPPAVVVQRTRAAAPVQYAIYNSTGQYLKKIITADIRNVYGQLSPGCYIIKTGRQTSKILLL